jgi:FMN phosphatase YigB (HAD superfamily)
VTALRVLGQALRYGRTWGVRAAARRAAAELRNAWRRAGGAHRAAAPLFDRVGFDAALADPDVKAVLFDVFDTLIERPLAGADDVHRVVALRVSAPDFVVRRRSAEAEARRTAHGEIALADIVAVGVARHGGDAAALAAAEIRAEFDLALPRAAGLALLNAARAAGKRIVIASDTALPHDAVERMLRAVGVDAFDALCVSSALGARKSTGALYQRVLADTGLRPEQVLVVGDHALSDEAMPVSLGLRACRMPSAAETAGGFARFAAWSGRAADATLGGSVLAGLLVRRLYSDPGMSRDRAALVQGTRADIGYAVVGPLLVAFSQWLAGRACDDGVRRLHFVAREGRLLLDAFRRLHAGDAALPAADYLVLSRRAVSVPAMRTREDVLEVARTAWLPTALGEFLSRRFGLHLDDQELDALDAAGLWPRERVVSVISGRVDALVPVLDALMERILACAAEEREALAAYLVEHALGEGSAIVDVGYAASTQARLCALSGARVHGYYLLTRSVAAATRKRFEVVADGCFAHDVATPEDSPLLRYCLGLELLMGADEAQVVCYRREGQAIVPRTQALTDIERASAPLRAEIRAGAMAFIDDWRDAVRRVGVPIEIDHDAVVALFREFWEGIAASERALLADIAGDDHYCGRGVVRIDDLFGPGRRDGQNG